MIARQIMFVNTYLRSFLPSCKMSAWLKRRNQTVTALVHVLESTPSLGKQKHKAGLAAVTAKFTSQ